ncbi:MAG: AI-2E family transporter [Acidimicrobiales bacterium]|nr:AI-2E family transporter [Acidimicrobiales bacterium]
MTAPQPADTLPENDGMPRWVPRAIGLLLGGVIFLWLLRELFESLSGFLVTILISFFFSFALEPAVNFLEKRGVRRGFGTLIMFSAALILIGGFSFIVGTVLAEQTTHFVEDAPELIDDLEVWLQENIDETTDLNAVRDQFLNEDGLGEQLTGLADNVVGIGATVVGLVFQIFTIALFTFYLTADGPRLRRTICSRLKPDRQRRVLGVWDLAIQKTGGYILSRTVLATISSIVTWIAFNIIGVPFPLALAVWVGVVSQFVPVVGVYIAGALPVILTLLESPTRSLWALLFLVAYQQFENYLLAPRIDSKTLKIHPAVSFGSVLVGASVLGPAGALLALPAAATAQGIISASGERYAIEEGPLTRIGSTPGKTATTVVEAALPEHGLDEPLVGDDADGSE